MIRARLHVITEGQTEREFVSKTIACHLGGMNIAADASCVLTSKDPRHGGNHKGGMSTYAKAKRHIQTWLKADAGADCRFTTMFDLYGLPNDFPGWDNAKGKNDPYEKVRIIEEALAADINDNRRFIPYIQLHEFEALLFSRPSCFAKECLEFPEAVRNLELDLAAAPDHNPELINGNPETAPSKRIFREIPDYDKANAGPSLAASIGLEELRSTCRHFGEWLARLERLGAQ